MRSIMQGPAPPFMAGPMAGPLEQQQEWDQIFGGGAAGPSTSAAAAGMGGMMAGPSANAALSRYFQVGPG